MARVWPENTRVLVVEDDYLTARMLLARLEREGITVCLAANGLEALQSLGLEPFDMVVTDLMMPAMNGQRLIQEIRDMAAPVGKVPILVISSNQNEPDMVACFSAGADDFMSKPISIPLFMERLWRLRRREG